MSKTENSLKFHNHIFHEPIEYAKEYALPKEGYRPPKISPYRRYREKVQGEFYAAIAKPAGFPIEYEYLDPNRFVVKWKGRKVTSVHIKSYPNSVMSSSAVYWENFKSLANELLPFVGKNTFFMFDYHHLGYMSMCSVSDTDMVKNELGIKLRTSEELHGVLYNALAQEHRPFPQIYDISMNPKPDHISFYGFYVIVHTSFHRHLLKKFEDHFLPQYADDSPEPPKWHMDLRPYPRKYSFSVSRLIPVSSFDL